MWDNMALTSWYRCLISNSSSERRRVRSRRALTCPAIRRSKDIAQISGTEANGNQRYDALQATLQKRYSSGLQYRSHIRTRNA